jgi:Alanine racemase
MSLRSLARVNLAAIERNAARLRRELSGGGLCAVVKADGYGHGAIPAALAGGAGRLAVVTVEEAAELRAGGISGPVLVIGAISAQELPVALAARADPVAWSERFVADVAAAASAPVRMHVKFDSGLGRLGTRDLQQAMAVARRVNGGEHGYCVGRSDDVLCDC